MSEGKKTSFMRYARVHGILKGDNALSKRLGKKTAAVCKPNQTYEDFPVEVIAVTDEIHKQGLDAHVASVPDVLRIAADLLFSGKPLPMPSLPEPPVRAKKVKAPKAAKAKKRKAPPPEPPPPPPAPKAAKAKVKSARRPKVPATAERPAAVEPTQAGSAEPSALPPKPPAMVRPSFPYVVGVAALSNLQAVVTLLEPFAAHNDTDAKEFIQKVNSLIDEVHRRTVLPSAEAQSSTTG